MDSYSSFIDSRSISAWTDNSNTSEQDICITCKEPVEEWAKECYTCSELGDLGRILDLCIDIDFSE